MRKLSSASPAVAIVMLLSSGAARAEEGSEAARLLRDAARYNDQIVDDAGLGGPAAAPRHRNRLDERAASPRRSPVAPPNAPAISTPYEETAYYPQARPLPWSGFYIGLDAGGVFGNRQNIATTGADAYDQAGIATGAAFATSAFSSIAPGGESEFLGGGQIGFNHQIQNAVVGVEADFQATTAGGGGTGVGAGYDGSTATAATATAPATPATTPLTLTRAHASLINFGTLRGRAGYLVTPTLLAYVTGGLAYGQTNVDATVASVDTSGLFAPGFGSASYGSVHAGWTGGAGVEWMFWPRWSAKLEYLYYDLGAPSLGKTGIGATGATSGQPLWAYVETTKPPRFSGSIARAGVNYHLDWGVPGSIPTWY